MFNSSLVSKVKSIDGESSSFSHIPPVDFEDPDCEPEEPFVLSRQDTCANPHYRIEVTSASYKTYRAVLCWILSNEIIFAPITSSATPRTFDGDHSRSPAPVSPKSVFRLAHFLEIPTLKKTRSRKLEVSIDGEQRSI